MERFYELLRARAPEPRIADLGSGGRRHRVASVGLDLRVVPGVDVKADTMRLPFRSASFDGVVITDVLMYVDNPFAVAAEVRRILKPGGVLYAAEPFLYAQMTSPSRFRFTVEGLRAVFADFEQIETGFGRSAGSAVLPLLGYYLAAALSFNSYAIYRAIVYVLMFLLSPFLWLDLAIQRYGNIPARIYTNAYFLGRARGAAEGRIDPT
jgi:SAM-dependent methyltransferase